YCRVQLAELCPTAVWTMVRMLPTSSNVYSSSYRRTAAESFAWGRGACGTWRPRRWSCPIPPVCSRPSAGRHRSTASHWKRRRGYSGEVVGRAALLAAFALEVRRREHRRRIVFGRNGVPARLVVVDLGESALPAEEVALEVEALGEDDARAVVMVDDAPSEVFVLRVVEALAIDDLLAQVLGSTAQLDPLVGRSLEGIDLDPAGVAVRVPAA